MVECAIGSSSKSMCHVQRPSRVFDRARTKYPACSSSRSMRRTRSRPIRSPGPARCCSRKGSETSRMCQPSGFERNHVATARVSNCKRGSSINAREMATHPRLRGLMRSTACSVVVSCLQESEGGREKIVSGGRAMTPGCRSPRQRRLHSIGVTFHGHRCWVQNCLLSGCDIAVDFSRRDERTTAVLLYGDRAAANALVESCATDAEDSWRFGDLEAQLWKGFRNTYHDMPHCRCTCGQDRRFIAVSRVICKVFAI